MVCCSQAARARRAASGAAASRARVFIMAVTSPVQHGFVKRFSASASQQCKGSTKPAASVSRPGRPGEESRKRVQRVRIGLTGLAFVFLLVLLGAVFTSPSNEEPITPNSIETQLSCGNQAAAAVNQAQPKEPL